MKVLQGVTEFELRAIVNKAWDEKDAVFLVDFATNRINVCSSVVSGVYQFDGDNIMRMAELLIDGCVKYAMVDFKFVQVNMFIQVLGRCNGVDMMIKALGLQNMVKPINETPYGVFLR